MITKKLFFFIGLLISLSLSAQKITQLDYSPAEGKTTSELKTALSVIISKDYHDVGYDGLREVYRTSDNTASGNVWDMYSTCIWSHDAPYGSSGSICGAINREHSIPQSWFNRSSPMRSDAFHVYPTDSKVNNMRGNDPFGETNAAPIGGKGLGKVGPSSFPGYSGTVFEPADEYKGDFARTYFYFVTRYEDRMFNFAGASFNTSTPAAARYPSLTTWSAELFIKWHRQDPVSQKEIDRNNAISAHQNNRNPFIDHPELAEHIWGNKRTTPWTLNGTTPTDPDPDCHPLNFSAPFTSTMAPFTAHSVSGFESWAWRSAAYGVVMSGYVSGTNYANEDWLISPVIDLENYENIQLSFEHTINKGDVSKMKTENTLWISTNYTGDFANATWKQIPIKQYPTGSNWDFVNSDKITIPQEYAQENTRIAFKYICSDQSSSTWEIKNLIITGACKTSSVKQEIIQKKYPISTFHNNITIYNLENEIVSVFDIYGRNIANVKNTIGNTTINIPISGVYIVKIDSQTIKVIVK